MNGTSAMLRLLVIIACIIPAMAGDTEIPGIQFGDNMATKYVTQENGVAMVTTDISNKLTFCAWVYPMWSRWRKYILGYY